MPCWMVTEDGCCLFRVDLKQKGVGNAVGSRDGDELQVFFFVIRFSVSVENNWPAYLFWLLTLFLCAWVSG